MQTLVFSSVSLAHTRSSEARTKGFVCNLTATYGDISLHRRKQNVADDQLTSGNREEEFVRLSSQV